MYLVKIEVDLRDEAKEGLSASYSEVTSATEKTLFIIKERYVRREKKMQARSGPFSKRLLERVLHPKPGLARYYRLFPGYSKKEIEKSDSFRDAALICLRFLADEQRRWEIRCRELNDELEGDII